MPRISTAYKLGNIGQVSLAFGRFYQDPENDYLKFTRKINPELAEHYIINYQYEKNKRVFRIETYYKRYDHLVKYNKANDPDPASYNNNGSGYAKGIDIFYRDKTTLPNGDFWISYSYLDSKRNAKDYPVLATPEYFSRHNFTAVYKQWIPPIQSNIGLTYNYLSGRPYFDPNKPAGPILTPTNRPALLCPAIHVLIMI